MPKRRRLAVVALVEVYAFAKMKAPPYIKPTCDKAKMNIRPKGR